MSSEKKKRKVSKKLHWGRGGKFLKEIGKGIKGLSFFTPSQRKLNNKECSDTEKNYLDFYDENLNR